MKNDKEKDFWVIGEDYVDPEETKEIEKSKIFGDVDLSGKLLDEIPKAYKDSIINGNFNISRNELKNLKNCPKIINGDLIAHHNNLLSLEYGPDQVKGNYVLHANKILLLYGIDRLDRKMWHTSNSSSSGYFFNDGISCGFQSGSYDSRGWDEKQWELHKNSMRERGSSYLGSSAWNIGNRLLSFKGYQTDREIDDDRKEELFDEALNEFNKLDRTDFDHILELLKVWDPESFIKVTKKMNIIWI